MRARTLQASREVRNSIRKYMLDVVAATNFDPFILQKPVLQQYPPHDLYMMIRRVLTPIAPPGLTDFVLVGGSAPAAVEAAIRAAVLHFGELHGLKASSGPIKGVSVLAFENASHGRSFTGLSLSHDPLLASKFPSIEVVKAPFPQTRLPLTAHEKENKEEEARCLEAVNQFIVQRKDSLPIAAIIVEPIQHRNNRMASRVFFKHLRKLAATNAIPFILPQMLLLLLLL